MGSSNTHRLSILSVPVDALTGPEIERWIGEQFTRSGPVRHIVTYNPEYAIAARRDPVFLAALRSADLVTADGVGITLAAKLQRHALALQRITGVRLLGMLAATGEPVFLLGAGPGVAKQAAEKLQGAHPEARIAGWWWEGTSAEADDAEAIRRITESGARIVAVAYGAPGQVLWIERNRAALAASGVRIAIGVGGALDYWAGTAVLPPAIIRRLGVEWLYRLIREPWRWKRQLALPHFALLAGLEGARTWLPGSQRNRVS